MGKFFLVFNRFIWALFAVLSFSGCSNPQKPLSDDEQAARAYQLLAAFEGVPDAADATQPSNAKLAEGNTDGTSVPSMDLLAEKNFHIGIPKAAMRLADESGKVTQKETEFLLSASAIPQAGAPTSTALNGRVVYFQLFEDGVDMYESTAGLVVTDEMPAQRLLAKFPIVSQDDNKVVINFDQGMKTLFVSSWIDGKDNFDESIVEASTDALFSRVHSVQQSPGRLTISQSVQTRVSMADKVFIPRQEMKYYLTPYLKTAYQPKVVGDMTHVRFFRTFPNLEKTTGKSKESILRFDLNKPITFAYSANTPAEFVQAVTDGILYWNRAFGREIVRAVKAPEGISAPDPDYNVVQWVPWDSAGFAYADVIADPRTGQSLHGQVYFTSVFAIKGIERARTALRLFQGLAQKSGDKKREFKGLGIRFLGEDAAWQPGGRCEQHPTQAAASVAAGLSELLNLENVSDQNILEISRNYIREVVAHEIGHVLGLRHHFAANLGATLTAKEQLEWFTGAVTKGDFAAKAGKYPSTSVMEYTEFMGAVYSGQVIREGKEILPYDRQSIQWGYFDDETINKEKTLYCSDEESQVYADCQTFDPTGDTFLGTQSDIAKTIRLLPGQFVESYVAAVAPYDDLDIKKVEEVNTTANFAIQPVADALKRSLAWFKSETKLISINNQFPFVGPLNEQERKTYRWQDLKSKITRVGGTDRLLFAHLPVSLTVDLSHPPEAVVESAKFEANAFSGKVAELLNTVYAKFVGLNGKEYQFSDSEKQTIVNRAKSFGKYYEEQLLLASLSAFSDAPLNMGRDAEGVKDDEDVISKIEKQYINLAKEIILTTDSVRTRTGKIRSVVVTVPEFKYSDKVRALATKILDNSLGSTPYWSTDARSSIQSALKSKVESALRPDDSPIKETDLSLVLRTWYAEQQKILSSL